MTVILSAAQTTEPLSGEMVQVFLTFEAVCRRLGLRFGLYCHECRDRGMADGVRGANAPTDRQYVIECGHLKRVWTNGANHG